MRSHHLAVLLLPLLAGCAEDDDSCACEEWEECLEGLCTPMSGRCDTAADCTGADAWCDLDHVCQPARLCSTVDCGTHGRCTAPEGSAAASCACDDGYAGGRCDGCADGFVPLADGRCAGDPCTTPDLCGTHGTCTPDPADGSASCICAAGWARDLCDACADGWYPAGADCVDRIRFALPLDRALVSPPVIGIDHVAGPGTSRIDCRDYADRGFPYCYDEHDGTDLLLSGGFTTMDAGSSPVLAAADGEVLETHDGEYDRCRADAATMDVVCGDFGYVTPANYVKLVHADGTETWYWHLKQDSVLVAVGDHVVCGQPLGLVGSSGYSSMPHVHFEVVDSAGTVIDPFAGPLSQPDSLWVEQDAGDGLPGSTCQGF
jgi:hypothetical protein